MAKTIDEAVTVTFRAVMGNKRIVAGTYSPSDWYATGGDAFTVAMLSLRVVEQVIIVSNGGFIPEWDKTNSKVLVKSQEPTNATSGVIAQTQCAGNADLHALIFPFVAFGH